MIMRNVDEISQDVIKYCKELHEAILASNPHLSVSNRMTFTYFKTDKDGQLYYEVPMSATVVASGKSN